MQANTETLKLLIDAIKDEKRRIANELYYFQKTVSQFATAKECAAYNQGLRDFAEKLLSEIDG